MPRQALAGEQSGLDPETLKISLRSSPCSWDDALPLCDNALLCPPSHGSGSRMASDVSGFSASPFFSPAAEALLQRRCSIYGFDTGMMLVQKRTE